MACDGYEAGASFQVSVVGRWDESADIINSFQFQLQSSVSPLTIEEVALDLRDIIEDVYETVIQFCNVVTIFSGIIVSEMDGDCSTGLIPFVGAPLTGSGVANAVPPGVAALLKFPTGIKRGQLRKYFGGLDSTAINSEGNLTGTVQGHLNTIGNFLLGTIDLSGFGTWKYFHVRPAKGATPAMALFPISRINSPVPAYQRRRRPGTGA